MVPHPDAVTAEARAHGEDTGAVPAGTRRWPAILGVAALLLAGPLVLGEYARQILSQAVFFAIAAITVDLLWGYTGILTFGQMRGRAS